MLIKDIQTLGKILETFPLRVSTEGFALLL